MFVVKPMLYVRAKAAMETMHEVRANPAVYPIPSVRAK